MAPQREWFEKDYYSVLGVSQGADEKDIKRAYKNLARKLHPDQNPGDSAAEDRFKDVSAAYDVLGDAEKRKEYDQVREMVANGYSPGAGGNDFGGFDGNFQNIRFDVGGEGGLGDILGGLFGGGRRRGARRAHASGSPARQRPRDTVAPRLRRRRARHHDVGVVHGRGVVLDVPRFRRRARHGARDVPAVRWLGRDRGRPGPVLVLAGVPELRWARPDHPDAVSHVSRPRRRGAAAHGQGAHPRGRRRRATHPREGPRRGRCERRRGRRSVRRRARSNRIRASAGAATT